MILLIDNYDSFTFNLVHLIGGLGEEVVVKRNDALTVQEALDMKPEAVVLSPGPCTPNEAGICLDMVNACAENEIPLFGVCLGHQSIAQAFGADIVRAKNMMHGKMSKITHQGEFICKGLPDQFTATRYHSLVAKPESLSNRILPIAHSEDDHEIMALAIKDLPIFGVQFHPESIASEYGAELIRNFLDLARNFKTETAA